MLEWDFIDALHGTVAKNNYTPKIAILPKNLYLYTYDPSGKPDSFVHLASVNSIM